MSKSDIKAAVLSQVEMFTKSGGVSLVFMQRNIKAEKHEVTEAVNQLKKAKKIKSKVTKTGIKYFIV